MNYLCAVDNFFYDQPNGVSRVAIDTAFLMRDHGHRVTMLCQKGYAANNADPVTEYDGIRVIKCNNINIRCFPHGPIWSNSAKFYVKKYLSNETFDVVHIHSLFTGKGVMQALGDSTRYIYTVHSPVVLEQSINWLHQGLAGKAKLAIGLNYFKKLENHMLNAASGIHVLSQFTKNEIQRFHGQLNNICVIPHWAKQKHEHNMTKQKARQILNWPEKMPILFTVRNHIPRTGLDVAIQAMAPLTINDSCLFVVAGDGPLRKTLQQQAIKEGTGPSQILFTGHLTEKQLNLAYQAADMFILPTSELECFGLIILEALGYGCPVIASNVGAIPEILDPILPDFIIPPNQPGQLRAKVKDWLDSKILSPGENNLINYVQQRFDREIIGGKIVDFIAES